MSRALILMYHSIDIPRAPSEARFCVTPAAFRAQMCALRDVGLTPIRLTDLVECLRNQRPIPIGSVAITFDDGFECFQRNALPVLEEFDIPSTLFAVAGKIGSTNSWMHTRGWPERKLMTASDLRTAQTKGVTIGCHGMDHIPMTRTSDIELTKETHHARQVLCDSLGNDVTLFAYPHGAQGDRERRAVAAAGFDAACSTEPGFNRHDANLYALRRLDIYGSDTLSNFRQKVRFGANRVNYHDLARYYLRRIYTRLHG